MAEQVNDNKRFNGIRLPSTFKALRYELTLKPDLEKFTYEGTVKIKFNLQDNKDNSIILHANELQIKEGYAFAGDQKESVSKLNKVTYNKDNETVVLDFENQLDSNGHVFLQFTGTLNDKMKGFYRTAYKVGDEITYAATTQFEATDARRCFPCVDEPDHKAVFSVAITFDSSVGQSSERKRIALSNTPVQSSSCSPGKPSEVTVTFKDTPIMSTYLLAFCVGEFEKIEATDGKRPICVYTTPGKKEQGRFALEVACKSLIYYEEYFGIEYPLEKMDLIAIPDFACGAMENWGLVTYRETCLLFDEGNTSTDRKQYIAIVVAHELAHQWFGNLVTMQWWTHLWLNEGFASFMEYLCVDHIFPEYDIWSQFVTDAYSRALDLDSLHNSHPIEVPVKHPSEIDEIFDDISYSKGASVIRMLYNYIGDANFRKGMKDYLTKFSYKNAVTEDLWKSLEEASNKPVSKFMSGWTSQKGFPWLSVASTVESGNAKLTLTQEKFTSDGVVPTEEADVKWLIPISAITGSNLTKAPEMSIFEGKSGTITVEGAGDSWIKLNPGSVSLYRTAYPEDMAKKFLPAIQDQTLPPMDRLGLQNDFFALCQAGKVKTVDLLKLLEAFKSETNYTVWNSIDGCIGRLNLLLANTDYQEKFHAFGRKLYADIFNKLTWLPQENEKHTDAMTRALIINRLVSFGDEKVIEEAKRRCKTQFECGEMIPADLRSAVYKAASVYGDEKYFEALFNIYRTAELHEEKNRAIRALGFTKEPSRLQRVIDLVLSDEVRNQDKVFIIIPIGVTNPPVAWKLLQDHKDMLREKYESGALMSRIVKYSTENFASEEKAQEISKFFEENKFPGTERTIRQSLETIRLNANWLARDSDAIKTFLS